MLKNIGLWMNIQKPRSVDAAREIRRRIVGAGGHVFLAYPPNGVPSLPDMPAEAATELSECGMTIVLGGDGTLLAASRQLAPHGIPLLGVNLGRRGFLASAEAEELEGIVDAVLADSFFIDERMMLEAETCEGARHLALNDLGVFNCNRGRMIRVLVRVDGEVLDEYYADGILVSSPTGSTAYSLSAGGPLIVPDMACMLITPICAHALHTRPVVVSADSEVTLLASSRYTEVQLTADGQEDTTLRAGQSVTIRKAAKSARLVRLKRQQFFEVVRQKISEWGTAELKNGGAK